MISDVLPLDTVSITNAANTLIRGAANKSYNTVMSDLAKTVDALMAMQDSENLKDDNSVQNLLETITPESAEIIEDMLSDELIADLGVNEESSETMTGILSSTLNKIAATKEDPNVSDEELQKEVESITYVINTAIDISSGDGSKGEEITMTEYVDHVLESKILTETIIENTYDENGELTVNPLDASYEPSVEQKAELTETLNERLSATSEEDKESTEKAIKALGSLINVEVIIIDGQVIIP